MKISKLLLVFLFFLFTILNVKAKDFSESSIVIDQDSGRILYQNNAQEPKLIASTTKILTAIITIEKANLNQEVEVGEEVLKMYGTNIYLEVGEKIKIIDLLYGLLLRSGNDAAIVLAKNVSGSEEKFVAAMNKKAQELGMKNSIFNNPHGLDEETKNYSTAYDMALLMRYASKNKTFMKISNTKKYQTSTGKKTYLWYNRNKLLTSYEYCTGGKNGYTPSAGKTLVSTATKDNLNLIIVSLKDQDPYTTHKNLYNQIFNQYQNYQIINKDNFYIDKTFINEDLYIKDNFYYPLTLEETTKVKTIVNINNKSKSKKPGKITIYLNNKKIGSIPIYKKIPTKKEETFFSKLKSFFT